MFRLTQESKKKIETLVEKGATHPKIYQELWKANTTNQLIKSLRESLQLNIIMIPRIWSHIAQNVWKTPEDVFEKEEILLFKELINQEGVLLYSTVRTKILTTYMASKTANALIDRGILCCLETESHDKILMFNPELLKTIIQGRE